MKSNIIIALIAAIGLAACTVGQDYERPPLTAPETLQFQSALKSTHTQQHSRAPLHEWWQGYEDPVLDKLVALGLANNFSIKAAEAKAEAAGYSLELAQAKYAIKADMDLDGAHTHRYSRRRIPSLKDGKYGIASLDASIPIDLFGVKKRALEAAEAEVKQTQAAYHKTLSDTVCEIVTTYLQLRGHERQLTLLNKAIDLQGKTLQAVETRFEKGLATELDVLKARASFHARNATLPSKQHDINAERNRLAVLMGAYPSHDAVLISQTGFAPTYRSALPLITPEEILKANPDIIKAEAKLQTALASIGLAEAAYYPSLKLEAGIDVTSSLATSLSVMDLFIGTIAASISQVIFDGGAREAREDAAREKARMALSNYELALRETIEAVESQLSEIEAAQATLQELARSFEASKQSFVQARSAYEAGAITFLNLADAQARSDRAERRLASEQTKYAVLIAQLFEKLGAVPKPTPSEIVPQDD